MSLGDVPLTTLEEIPETPWKIIPFYGTLYRTWDYPNTDGCAYPEVAEDVVTTLEAMKIGGVYPSPWVLHELCWHLSILAGINGIVQHLFET